MQKERTSFYLDTKIRAWLAAEAQRRSTRYVRVSISSVANELLAPHVTA